MSATALESLMGLLSSPDPAQQAQLRRDFLPLLVLLSGDKLQWAPDITQLMTAFAARLGMDGSYSSEELGATVGQFYREHPRQDIVSAIKTALRESTLEASSPAGAETAVRAFLGLGGTMSDPGEHKKTGGVAGGPMARFNLARLDED